MEQRNELKCSWNVFVSCLEKRQKWKLLLQSRREMMVLWPIEGGDEKWVDHGFVLHVWLTRFADR